MDDKQLIGFKQQMQSSIYNNAFINIDKWTAHLIYMIYNPDEYWLNILSIFNFREAPVRVLRHAVWKEKVEPANPMIKKGLTGIPVLVKEKRMNRIGGEAVQERIVHDAWDINDFVDGEKFIITSPFFDEIKCAQKYDLKIDLDYWNEFLSRILEIDFPFLSAEIKTFLKESFLYLIYGSVKINLDYISIHKDNANVLCRIYKNMANLINTVFISFKSYVSQELSKQESEKEKEAFAQRMKRKLPQRLEDAERRLVNKGV